jgi:hypothetical protein
MVIDRNVMGNSLFIVLSVSVGKMLGQLYSASVPPKGKRLRDFDSHLKAILGYGSLISGSF